MPENLRFVHDPYSFNYLIPVPSPVDRLPAGSPPVSPAATDDSSASSFDETWESQDNQFQHNDSTTDATTQSIVVFDDNLPPLMVNLAPCPHVSTWKRQRSKKDRAFFHCRTCVKSFCLHAQQAVNFRLVIISPPAGMDCQSMLRVARELTGIDDMPEREAGPRCDHVENWKRLRSRTGCWHFHCEVCHAKWRVPTPSALRANADELDETLSVSSSNGVPGGWWWTVNYSLNLLYAFY
eukprot:TRINITY_DN13633_c0_g1_i1.p1 TRINITY_DN13633_c0_g1~~TRINITY_DN13633_c0_g1_i1.p1  ORF type:complete len:238 (-),score=35.58 TRINITY_DN13633_c0_g1_i1:433-1146(-)